MMSSRFCLSFNSTSQESTAFVHRSLPPEAITTRIGFSVEYWQPFIDQRDFKFSTLENSSNVCGPLLGILVELANAVYANLTFVPDNSDEILPFPEMDPANGTGNGFRAGSSSVQVVLTPYAPMSLSDERVTRLVRFSSILGDIPMISILSGKEPLTMDFEAVNLFNYAFFYLYFIALLFVNVLAFVFIPWKVYPRFNLMANSLRIFFKQPFDVKRRKGRVGDGSFSPFPALPHLLLLPHLFLLTGLFHLLFSAKLLAFFTFALPYKKVDSLAELLAEKGMAITLFKGETSVEVLLGNSTSSTDDNLDDDGEESGHLTFAQSRITIVNPLNEDSGDFEIDITSRINARSVALISDSYYLDYIFNSHVHRNPRLYRGAERSLVLPYFLPLSVGNSPELNGHLNRLISKLRESGIYEFWLWEVKLINGARGIRSGRLRRQNSIDYDFLTLSDFRLVFYLLFGLQALSVLAFGLEIIVAKKEKMGRVLLFLYNIGRK